MTTVIGDIGMSKPLPPTSHEALSALYRDERVGLLQLAMLLTRDAGAAEDIVHDAFVSLQRRWNSISDPASAGGYLRASVVNGCRTRHRRADVARRHLGFLLSGSEPSADVPILVADEHRAVLDAVRRLPPRQQEVVVLRYWANMSEAEIASTLKISRGTVKSSASRALAALTSILEGSDE